jgi:hypothetical protein
MQQKCNLWTVLNPQKVYRDNKVYLLCRCECGVEKEVIIKNLKSGVSASCGCVGRRKTTERNYKHGLRFSRTWRIWRNMKSRCYNPNIKQYKNYGGRGIIVSEKWKDDFLAFYKDVGDIPEGYSIDRIDNNGNYEPDNVRIATAKEQCQNKTNNRKINGRCISTISRELGGEHSLVAKRLKRGWDLEKAITEKTYANR